MLLLKQLIRSGVRTTSTSTSRIGSERVITSYCSSTSYLSSSFFGLTTTSRSKSSVVDLEKEKNIKEEEEEEEKLLRERVNETAQSPTIYRNDLDLVDPAYKRYSYVYGKTERHHPLVDTIDQRMRTMAEQKPNDEAFKFMMSQVSMTFGEVKQRVDAVCGNLSSLGFRKGDRLAVCLPNVPESVVTLHACAQLGLIVVLMNPAYQQVEIEYMLHKSQAKGLLFLDNLKTLKHYDCLTRIIPELPDATNGELNSRALPHLKHLICVKNRLVNQMPDGLDGDSLPGCWSYDLHIQKPNAIEKERSNINQKACHVDFDDPFVILFTSGTTGLPKGALLSHMNCINSGYVDTYYTRLVGGSKTIGCPIPIFHSFGLMAGALEPFIQGARCVFPALFPDTEMLLKSIHAERITALKGAPIIFLDMLNHPDRSKYDLSSVEYVLIGGSTVPRSLIERMRNELGIKNILIGYGLTETSAAGLMTTPEDNMHDENGYALDTVGRPICWLEAKIVDKERRLAPVDQVGEICVRGNNVFMGYWDEPEKTAEVLDKNGWFHTGDMGAMNSDGYVYFKSREKEIIIRGGTNIYPAEVEAFVRTNPLVLDCYCFSVPDERVGEEVAIWIKLRDGNSTMMTKENLLEFCDGKISKFKVPRHVKFVDEFPINANGKVQKFKMTEQTVKELNLSTN